MKKMNLLAVMALLSLGSVNVIYSDPVAEVASILATAVATDQTYKFGYGENQTASVTLDLLSTSFNSFSQAVHDAIHSPQNSMNFSQGQQAQFLAPDKTPLNVGNYIWALVFAQYNPAWKDGDLCFNVSKIYTTAADEVVPAE